MLQVLDSAISHSTSTGGKTKQNKNNHHAFFSICVQSFLTMLIIFKAAPRQIELQKQAWSHLKDFEKIFHMRLSSFLQLNLFKRSFKLNQRG